MSREFEAPGMVDNLNPPRMEGIAQLDAYWHALRGTRDMPLRADIDPRGIEDALDFAFIVERVTAGVARFRLAGSNLNEMMGMDVRGMPLTSFFGTDSRSQMASALERVFSGPEILEVSLTSAAGVGRAELQGQMILMPLRSDLGDVTRAIGCLPTKGTFGRAPRRFETSGRLKRRALDGTRPLFTNAEPASEEPTLIGMAEDRVSFDRDYAPVARSERPYLRLVKDDSNG